MFPEKVTFSLPCLKTLVKSDRSCVSCKSNYRRTLNLLPVHLNDLKKSVQEILASKVTTYDIELGGIILSHKNVKIASTVEMTDVGNFYLEYVADIYLFTPQIGSILSGRINKKGKDVLNCLVHNIFHVSLPKPEIEEGNQMKWLGNKVFYGQNITFTVVKLDFTGKLPYIRGEILNLKTDDTMDDEGVDSGMGLQESNDDVSTSDIDEKPNIHNLFGTKRKLSLEIENPEPKKRKYNKANLSDEGLSGEESVSTDTPMKTNSVEIKQKEKRSKPLIKQEYDEASVEEINTNQEKPKKRKKEKHSRSSVSEMETLLAEALKKTKIKVETSSLSSGDIALNRATTISSKTITDNPHTERNEVETMKNIRPVSNNKDDFPSGSTSLTKKKKTSLGTDKVKSKHKASVDNAKEISLSILKEVMTKNAHTERIEVETMKNKRPVSNNKDDFPSGSTSLTKKKKTSLGTKNITSFFKQPEIINEKPVQLENKIKEENESIKTPKKEKSEIKIKKEHKSSSKKKSSDVNNTMDMYLKNVRRNMLQEALFDSKTRH